MRASCSPCVAVFGLGGTIAMAQAPDGGVTPALSASDLLAAVPGLSDLHAELRVRDFRNKPGASLDFPDLYELASAITDSGLARERVGVVGLSGAEDPEGSIPHDTYAALREALPHADFVNASALMEAQRRVKSPEEQEFVR